MPDEIIAHMVDFLVADLPYSMQLLRDDGNSSYNVFFIDDIEVKENALWGGAETKGTRLSTLV